LITPVQVAREGKQLADRLADFRISRSPARSVVKAAAFVGESDQLSGNERVVGVE
jgi:hypothetical protein